MEDRMGYLYGTNSSRRSESHGFYEDAAIELQYLAHAIVEQSPVKHATRRKGGITRDVVSFYNYYSIFE